MVSAPSGGGKTTILNQAVKLCPNLNRSVSCTTRPPRKDEADGEDYHFISGQEFKTMMEKREFLEWAKVYGHLYGTPLEPINEKIAQGLDVALAIDIQGARSVKKLYAQAVFVFIMPPSLDELKRRLKNRQGGPDPSDAARLKSAGEEISTAVEYDYIIVNNHLDESVDQLKAIITAERLLRSRYIIHTETDKNG